MAKYAWIPNENEPIENINAALGVMKNMLERKMAIGLKNMARAGYRRDISELGVDAMYDPSYVPGADIDLGTETSPKAKKKSGPKRSETSGTTLQEREDMVRAALRGN